MAPALVTNERLETSNNVSTPDFYRLQYFQYGFRKTVAPTSVLEPVTGDLRSEIFQCTKSSPHSLQTCAHPHSPLGPVEEPTKTNQEVSGAVFRV